MTRELDAVALDGDGAATAIGSCKWSTSKPGIAEEALLTRLEAELPRTRPGVKHYLLEVGVR